VQYEGWNQCQLFFPDSNTRPLLTDAPEAYEGWYARLGGGDDQFQIQLVGSLSTLTFKSGPELLAPDNF
jgi:hypothetical protein